MVARTSDEEQKRKRRKRLVRGLLLGGAAVGVPALANALIARRVRRLPPADWGRSFSYAWTYGEVSFRRIGSGPPLVLLHAFGPGHDAEEWRSASETLADHFEVFAPDLLGWGRSAKPSMTYDDELYIQLLTDFLQDIVGERATVAGAGLTAAYAVQAAVDQPERIDSLILVGPAGIELQADEPDVKDAIVHRLLRLPVLGTSALNLYTSRAAITHYLRNELFAAPERADAQRIDHHYRSCHQPGAHHALAAYLSGYLNHPAEEPLGRLVQPTCIAWGRAAVAPPIESADLWLQRAPHCELEVFDDCGNLPHVEAPQRFAERVRSFLAEPAATGI